MILSHPKISIRSLLPIIIILTCNPVWGNEYVWPLKMPPVLTSSFGEYRPGRFHAGIDVHTNGIGRAVHAAHDGYVSRIRCSPWGYGKAVYITLGDGNTVVYAHLNSFSPVLEDYVRKKQHEARSYSVELFPSANMFPVKRGEVVAYSGQTGIGHPHLHYEIRDASQRPLVPQKAGITWSDKTRPQIQRLCIISGGPDSTINSGILPLIIEPQYLGNGKYTCKPVHASGRIGFALDIVDKSNGNANYLGIYRAHISAGNHEIFEVRKDRLSYNNINNGVVSYHPFLTDSGIFLVLWRWPDNSSEPFNVFSSNGWYEVPEDNQDIVIKIEDFQGNKADVTIPLISDNGYENIETLENISDNSKNGTVDLKCVGEYLVFTVTFPEAQSNLPILSYTGPPPKEGGRFRRISPNIFQAGYLPSEKAQFVSFIVTHDHLKPFSESLGIFHRRSKERKVFLGNIEMIVRENSPYGVMFLKACTTESTIPNELPIRGNVYEIWPPNTPIDDPVTISLPLPTEAETINKFKLFRATSKGWIQQKTEYHQGRVSTTTRNMGTYAVMEDNIAPVISRIIPKDGSNVVSRRPEISAIVSDKGTNKLEINVTCSGKWLLMEYDPEREQIFWARDENLPSGRHELIFRVADTSGNIAERSNVIYVP